MTGGGLRLNVKRNGKLRLHAGLGAMIESERWKSIQEQSEIIEKTILKNSSYFSGQFTVNEYVSLDLVTYYQGGYDGDSDLFRSRLSGDLHLSVKMTKKLALVTNFSLQYEDRPIIPINNLIYSLTNGLKWDF